LAKGSHGTAISGEIIQPTAEYVLAIGVVCSAATILKADLSFHLVIPPAVVLFHYANAIRWRSRTATDSSELISRIPAALDQDPTHSTDGVRDRRPGSRARMTQGRQVAQ
jgi:hypothetical protein